LSALVIAIFVLPYHINFIQGFIDNYVNQEGRPIDLLSNLGIKSFLKSILIIPLSQFPYLLGSFKSYDLTKFFNVLYGIPHIPYIGTSIVFVLLTVKKKVNRIFFIIPALIYLSPLRQLVYERVFFISLFGIFIFCIKNTRDIEFHPTKIKKLNYFLIVSGVFWFIGSVIYQFTNFNLFIRRSIMENIDKAFFPYDLYTEFYEQRFDYISNDFSFFSHKNYLYLFSLLLSIYLISKRKLKIVYLINLFQLIFYLVFHLSIPVAEVDTKEKMLNFDTDILIQIPDNSRILVVHDNPWFLKENILSIYGLNDVDIIADIYRPKIKSLDKMNLDFNLLSRLDIEYIVSNKKLNESRLELITTTSSFYIYLNNEVVKDYKFINNNQLLAKCNFENEVLEIPINFSKSWISLNGENLYENNLGGLNVSCVTEGEVNIVYLPLLHNFQPHSFNYNFLILLISSTLFFLSNIYERRKNYN